MMTQDIDTTEKDGHKKQEDREAADFISLFRTFFFHFKFYMYGNFACMYV